MKLNEIRKILVSGLVFLAILGAAIAAPGSIPVRGGDRALHADIHYDHDVLEDSYHGRGGIVCSVCNTTAEDAIQSREGAVYCLDCWSHFFWEEWDIQTNIPFSNA